MSRSKPAMIKGLWCCLSISSARNHYGNFSTVAERDFYYILWKTYASIPEKVSFPDPEFFICPSYFQILHHLSSTLIHLSQETQLKRLDAHTSTTALYAKYFEFLKIFHHAKQEFTKITD